MPMPKGFHHSEETKAKMRAWAKALGIKPPSFLGKHHSEETKTKISRSLMGEKHPKWKGNNAKPKSGNPRARRRYRCLKGQERHHIDGNPLNNAPENIFIGTRKEHMVMDGRIRGTMLGMRHSEESITKMRAGHKGKKHTEEWKAKQIERTASRLRDTNGRFRRVLP